MLNLSRAGNYSQWVAPNLDNFLYFFVIAVTAHARVSFMRVANVKVRCLLLMLVRNKNHRKISLLLIFLYLLALLLA